MRPIVFLSEFKAFSLTNLVGQVSYFEISAKNGQNVEAPFLSLAKTVLSARRNSSDLPDKLKKNSSSSLLA